MTSLADIERARERTRAAVETSPCARNRALSALVGAEVHLKLENLQRTGSFKERGAANKLLSLDAESRARGVVAASAGNHAQGVAHQATQLGIAATIVMPTTTPLVKVTATGELGARVVLHGTSYHDAAVRAARIATETGAILVHPFDDPLVIAGQGTLGLEILEQVPDVDVVVVPIGGGGLAAGVGVAIKSLRPDVELIGVEPERMPSMSGAFAEGHRVELPAASTLADGVNVRCVGVHTYPLCRRHLDGIVTVSEEEIAESVLLLLERAKTVAEGAGAVALAAVVSGRIAVAGRKVVVVVSGGNIDVNVVSRIIDRGLAKSGRLMRVRVTLPDLPGRLAALLTTLANEGANVLRIQQEGSAARHSLGEMTVELVLETRGFAHVDAVERALDAAGHRWQ